MTTQEIIQRGLYVKAATPEQSGTRRRTFVASTESLDSHDEIVEQRWNLERFNRNPVVLFAHDRYALPIGKGIAAAVVGSPPQLEIEVEFATAEANPQAELCWQSLQQGTLRACSVGFWPNEIRVEMREGREVLVLSDNDLYELSILAIGSNPDTLAKMHARAVRAPQQPAPREKATEMPTLEEVQKQLAEKIAAHDLATGEASAKIAALDAARLALVTERDEAVKGLAAESAKVKALTEQVNALEVDKLVGDKIDPADAEKYARLRALDPQLFTEIVKGLKPKDLTKTVVSDDAEIPVVGEGNDDDITVELKKRAATQTL